MSSAKADISGGTDTKSHQSCELADGKPCNLCKRANALDILIAETRNNLAQLLLQQKDLQQDIDDSHKRIARHLPSEIFGLAFGQHPISPNNLKQNNHHDRKLNVRRLPPEITGMIFQQSLTDYWLLSSKNDFKLERAGTDTLFTTPLILGAVCHTWRKFVWTSPYLWTHILVPIDLTENNPTTLDTAREWLNRAGGLPLSMCIHSPLVLPDSWKALSYSRLQAVLFNLAAFIQEYLVRCLYLEFKCPASLVPSFSGEAPILKGLKMVSTGSYKGNRFTLRGGMMPLQCAQVSITNYRFNYVDIEWEGVTSFQGNFRAHECIKLFRKASQLIQCDFVNFSEDLATLDHDVYDVTHQTLQSLKLDSGNVRIVKILDYLTLPSLTHFHLNDHKEDFRHKALINLFQRSSCNLTSMQLVDIVCRRDRDLVDVLRHTPHLRVLQLMAGDGEDYKVGTLFQLLGRTSVVTASTSTYLPTGDLFLPSLQELEVGFYVDTGFPWDLSVGIFGVTLDDLNHPQRRPLNTFRVIYDWRMGINWCSKGVFVYPNNYLDEEVTRRFIRITETGIVIDLRDIQEKVDMLQVAMEHHNVDKPVWYQSQVSNISLDRPSLIHLLDCDIPFERLDDILDYELDSYDSTEEPEPELESDLEDDRNDAYSDIWDKTFDPCYGLPDNVTGETLEMLDNYMEVDSQSDSEDSQSFISNHLVNLLIDDR